jgi:crotonobetainyl-CoA:carnitine CoA-transferase CaiB-like acyl-CoA transferase
LKARNPRLVYCSLSGFGQDGPYRLRPGYDLLFMGMSGFLQAILGDGHPPIVPGTFPADAVSGIMAALGIAVALVQRGNTEEGTYVEISMLESIFSMLAISHGLRRLRADDSPATTTSPADVRPYYNVYRTADDRYVVLAAFRPLSWKALCEELGRPDYIAHQYPSGAKRQEILDVLEHQFASAPAADWIERLSRLDIEIGPVNSPIEAFANPQLVARNMVLTTDHPQAGRLDQIGNPFHFAGDTAALNPAPAPCIGQDTEAILQQLGYDAVEMQALRDCGAI